MDVLGTSEISGVRSREGVGPANPQESQEFQDDPGSLPV
jgi:hypothetical protein